MFKPFLTAYSSNLFLWRLHNLPRGFYQCLENFLNVFINLFCCTFLVLSSFGLREQLIAFLFATVYTYIWRPLAYLLILCPRCVYIYIYIYLFFLHCRTCSQIGCVIKFTMSSATLCYVKDLDKEFAHCLLARGGTNVHELRTRPRIKFLLFYPLGCLIASLRK